MTTLTVWTTSPDATYPHEEFDWTNATDEQKCERWKVLDRRYNTDGRSPLSHDRRCVRCGHAR